MTDAPHKAGDGTEAPKAIALEALDQRLARSHRSVLTGLQKRLAMAEARLTTKEVDARTHHSDLKRERLYVEELRRAEARMRGVVERRG